MTSEAELMRAVCAAPDDDTPRLILADWYDEHDRPLDAAFIRAQIALHRNPKSPLVIQKLPFPEVVRLQKIERDWIKAHRPKFFLYRTWFEYQLLRQRQPQDDAEMGAQMFRLYFRRGYPHLAVTSAVEWLKHADELYWSPKCVGCGGNGYANGNVVEGFPAWAKCKVCDGTGEPRPFPPTARPLREVAITSWSGIDLPAVLKMWEEARPDQMAAVRAEVSSVRYFASIFADIWPGLQFHAV